MADSNKLVSLIILLVVGLLVAIWGGLFIWFNRKDKATIDRYVADGKITQVEADRLTNPVWIWALGLVQILLGIGLVIWGLFQYFAKVEDVTVLVKNASNSLVGAIRNPGTRLPTMSRRTAQIV